MKPFMPTRGEIIERCPWMVYSRLRVPFGEPTEPRYELLSDTLMTPDRYGSGYRQIEDTNMVCANRFPTPQAFVISSIHVVYGRMWEGDREEFRSRYMLEFQIAQKIFHQAPLLALPDRLRLIEQPKPGRPPQPGYFPGDYPLIVPANVYISARLIGKRFVLSDRGHGLNIMIVLNGLLDREVQ